ncbi:GumC family protein [Fulvivirga ligni]|uniref:GumC family protein n=1 Tax=Fulvivirga ligni TaxID=2904246 RepID=UPI001F2597D0|nr:GNVR domain-containing protein [Fulvivirga ligni]UII21329.1 Wzz/FepE/Etk N-terminal domain-containing protein [Fulvivirga ligni]
MKELTKKFRLLRPLLRGLPIIVVCFLIAVNIASRYLRYATPKYESAAKLRLADNNEGPTSTMLYKDFDIFTNKNKIGAEIEVIQSNHIINRALDSVDFDVQTYRVGKMSTSELYKESPFIVDYSQLLPEFKEKIFSLTVLTKDSIKLAWGTAKPIRTVFGEKIHFEGGILTINQNEKLLSQRPNLKLIDQYQFKVRDRAKLIKEVVSGLDIISIDKDIAILRVGYQHEVPQKTADMVNSLCQAYIDDYEDDKFKATNTTVEFLDEQLAEIGNRLKASENDIENYRNTKDIINVRQETETDLRQISQMRIQLANLKMNLTAIDSLYAYIEAGKANFLELAPTFEAFNDLLSTEMVKNLKALQAERKELLTIYTEEDEKVKLVNEKIDDIAAYLVESIKNTRNNLNIKYNQIKDAIAKAEEAFIGLPSKEKDMTILERNFMLNQKIYNFLHEKRTEAEIARAASISFHRIISRGEIPSKPVSPNKTLIMFVTGILGLGFGVASILIVHSMKAKVNDTITIEKNSDLPIAIEIPKFIKPSTIERGFQQLGIKLELKSFFRPGNVVCVSSFTDPEGRSFFVENLTKSLQKRGFNVAKVDAFDTNFDRDEQRLVFQNLSASTIKIIDNVSVDEDNYSLMLMSAADINLFMLDSRITPAKRIDEFNLLHDEYKLPNTFFGLNRADYNPSIIKLIFRKVIRYGRKYVAPLMKYIRSKKAVQA